jgi:ATP-dependent helicase YprA (DUF1998 family)
MPGLAFDDAIKKFGHQRLHPWQRKVLEKWSDGIDVLVLSGTGTALLIWRTHAAYRLYGLSCYFVQSHVGSGKSLCFQLPAVLDKGVVVCLSPLIALMRDQCHQLGE